MEANASFILQIRLHATIYLTFVNKVLRKNIHKYNNLTALFLLVTHDFSLKKRASIFIFPHLFYFFFTCGINST